MLKTEDHSGKDSLSQRVFFRVLASEELGSAFGPEMPALVTGRVLVATGKHGHGEERRTEEVDVLFLFGYFGDELFEVFFRGDIAGTHTASRQYIFLGGWKTSVQRITE